MDCVQVRDFAMCLFSYIFTFFLNFILKIKRQLFHFLDHYNFSRIKGKKNSITISVKIPTFFSLLILHNVQVNLRFCFSCYSCSYLVSCYLAYFITIMPISLMNGLFCSYEHHQFEGSEQTLDLSGFYLLFWVSFWLCSTEIHINLKKKYVAVLNASQTVSITELFHSHTFHVALPFWEDCRILTYWEWQKCICKHIYVVAVVLFLFQPAQMSIWYIFKHAFSENGCTEHNNHHSTWFVHATEQ